MPYRWEKRKEMSDTLTAGFAGHACYCLSAIFAIIGIVAAAVDADIGLGATNWFLLAIVVAILSIPFFIGLALAWFLREKKGEKT
jgi:uncharacterized membrane protein YdbT with pleckstrin-like domain